jgi:uncharacterized damage-inducible protein DinB
MLSFQVDDLIAYTDWERALWHDWFRQHGNEALKTSVGAHADGRFSTIGEVIRHIFSAERRYLDRLSDLPLTDAASIPAGDYEALFRFGGESRRALRQFLNSSAEDKWDQMNEINFGFSVVHATPRKIIVHVLMHEIRHWAQIATMFRLNGLKVEWHDFLFSPVFGGGRTVST